MPFSIAVSRNVSSVGNRDAYMHAHLYRRKALASSFPFTEFLSTVFSPPALLRITHSRLKRSPKEKRGEKRNLDSLETYIRTSDIIVFEFQNRNRRGGEGRGSTLRKLRRVGHIYYSRSLLSSNRIPARQRQPDSILIGCGVGGGGGGRESQFPERSRCNLRLKQRGGTTITDCIRST